MRTQTKIKWATVLVMTTGIATVGALVSTERAVAVDNPVVVMGSGDIAEGGTATMTNAAATGDLIREASPAFVFTTGDNAYPDGSATDFATKYDPTWGSFKAITHPSPGNHEYHSAPPAGYLGYFGQANVTTNDDPAQVWYAWDVGNGWRAYSLNTVVSNAVGSPQETWLKADLAAHPGLHYLAYAHAPRYISGTVHSDNSSVCPLWDDLQAAGGDIFLFGHEHHYERFAKLDCAAPTANPAGIREFVVGSGGNQLYALASPRHTGEEAGNASDYGDIKLTLHDGSYDWQFIASGRGYVNSTHVTCTGSNGCDVKDTIVDSGSAPTNNAPGTPSPTPSGTTSSVPTTTPPTTPSTTPPASTPPPNTGPVLHYVPNEGGQYVAAHNLGFNLHDTGMTNGAVNAVPNGDHALAWTGLGDCPSTTLPASFIAEVRANANNQKLYGYFIADEPSDPSAACVAGVRAQADAIHAAGGGKKAFILLTDYPGTYAAYAPARSHVDAVGVDPYPCLVATGTCNLDLINTQVNAAVAAGTALAQIVPVFQEFGDSTYRAPTAAQLQSIYERWATLVPCPPFDVAYTWNNNSGGTDSIATRPDWHPVIQAHNAVSTCASTSPSPSTSPSESSSPTPSNPTPSSPTPSSPTPSETTSPPPPAATRLVCPVVSAPVSGQTVVCTYE